jgi:glyoxylase-like metal-dependent hydrolase (beta-lactamase superfamily II)
VEGDGLLQSLGIHRLAIPVPFPDAGGPVNAYALDDGTGRLTFFDTGIGTEAGIAALRSGAAAASLDLSRTAEVLVSHGHVDHFGNAQLLAEESGAAVGVHRADRDKVVGEDGWAAREPLYRGYLRKQGVPEAQLPRLVAMGRHSGKFSRRVDPARARALEGGRRIQVGALDLEVLHLPGHTPGLVCLWERTHRLLFADDHILARTSPNPFLELTEAGTTHRALVRYLRSIETVRALDVDWVLPGHGPPFQGHRATIDTLDAFYRRRQERLMEALRSGPRTGVELSEVLFGPQEGARLYLTLSEAIGNIEVLEDARRVRAEDDGAVVRWRAVG